MGDHVYDYLGHMSCVTSQSRKNERVRETYKYVIADPTICPAVPIEQVKDKAAYHA